MREDNKDVYEFYEAGAEIGRLERGLGKVEGERTKELLSKFLPKGPLRICDVGGGSGYYSDWLAGQGHRVTLIDLAPSAVEYARIHRTYPYEAMVGDARKLSMVETESMDAVLLMGPLYHLIEEEERLSVLKEARRILKPGGMLIAAGISKFSSSTWAVSVYGKDNEFLEDKVYFEMLRKEILKNQHIRPKEYPNFLTNAYFHTPEGMEQELRKGGFSPSGTYAVEGCIWFCPTLQEKWEIPESRERLLELVRMTEQERSLLGISPHFLVRAKKTI